MKNKLLKIFYAIVFGAFFVLTIKNVYATETVDVSDTFSNDAKIESTVGIRNSLISFYADNAISGNLIKDKAVAAQVYLQKNGKNYTYTAHTGNYIRIYRYCYETNKYERIHYESAYWVLGTKVEGNIIYFYMWKDTYDSMVVKAYNTVTESFVSTVTLPVNETEFKSGFGVDSNQNYYLGLNGSSDNQLSLTSFDRNGKKIDQMTVDMTPSQLGQVGSYEDFNFFNTNKDNTVLFFSGWVIYSNQSWYNDFLVKMNNGKFETELFCIRKQGGMDYRFLNDERTLAYDQYGEILEINYNSTEFPGVTVEVLRTVNPDVQTFRTYTPGINDGTFVYIGSTKGMLYKYNFRTNLIDKYIDLGSDKYITFACSSGNNQALVEYKTDGKFYTTILNESEFVTPLRNVLLSSNHVALNHTKFQIKEMYENAAIKVVNDEYYQVKPNVVAAYKSGVLKEEVLTDILNQLNYFRWLTGLNGVEINREYLEQSQKGAVLLASSSEFAHAPSRPNDMNLDFYNAAKAATNGEIGFSANISSGSKPADSVKGYLDDVNNIYPNVGHRLSLLDCMATHASFGYAGNKGVINMFRETADNNEVYYSWPACGYFPINAMNPEAKWSVSINSNKYDVTTQAELTLRANGKEYVIDPSDIYIEKAYNAYYYDIPTELKNYLTNGTKSFVEGKNVEVELKGITDEMGNTYMIRYPVRFFSIDNTKEGILFEESKINLLKGSSKLVPLKYESGRTVTRNIKFETSNPDIITINSDGSFTACKKGKVTVTAIVDGVYATCEIEVSDFIKGDLNRDGKVNAADATRALEIFKNESATVEDLEIGDMDGRNGINANDATMILEVFKNSNI